MRWTEATSDTRVRRRDKWFKASKKWPFKNLRSTQTSNDSLVSRIEMEETPRKSYNNARTRSSTKETRSTTTRSNPINNRKTTLLSSVPLPRDKLSSSKRTQDLGLTRKRMNLTKRVSTPSILNSKRRRNCPPNYTKSDMNIIFSQIYKS